MKKKKHTPTPWKFMSFGEEVRFIVDEEDKLIADTYADTYLQLGLPSEQEAEANAEFICRAVNSHEGLVSALRNLIDRGIITDGNDHYDECIEALNKATSAEN